jgi:multiple sugar transport system permease protein
VARGLIEQYVAWLTKADIAMNLVIIADVWHTMPGVALVLQAALAGLPADLDEAARLDGCSRLGILWRVVMSISAPGLVSTAMFVFLLAWDEFFYALILTSTLDAKTVPVAITEFIGRHAVNVNGMMAGGILAAIPPVLVALIFQRYIVSGMTAGAVKG